ncbi:MAG: PKD domain-containing protein [Planctomycetota bacterium]|nr:PKD domain-containing protein [Planctomycetota bacterium]
MSRIPTVLGALCALTLVPATYAQKAHVIPNGLAAVEGYGSSSYHWNRTTGEIRVMYVYDSTHFTDAGINYPILINNLKGRANGSATATWTGGTYAMKIDMGTSVNDWMTASVTFDANYGADRTRVLDGNAVLKPSPITGGGIPQPEFYVDVALTTPFLYDPGSGNDLIIDFYIPTGAWTGGTSYSVDLQYTATATPPANGCRFWNLTASSPTAANASPQLHSSHVVEIGHTPAAGLYPSFDAAPTLGPAGMKVDFKDTSYSSRSGGVLVRTWNFGDSSPNGSGATTSHVYKCGVWDPILTVIDSAESKSTKPGYKIINAGQVTAAGSPSATTGFAPLSVTFTDETTGGPSAWSWDFGDGGTSNLQNPTHIYTKNGTYSVTLHVKTPCSKDSVTYTDLIEVGVGKLETGFLGGNGLSSPGSGNLFDVDILNPKGLKITSFDMSFWLAGARNIEVWVTPGSYIGNDNLPNKWVQVAAGAATAATGGYGSRTHVNTDDFYLPTGKYGMYIISDGGVAYTNGNGTNQNFGNADLALALGVGKNLKFSGSVFNPRIWNGAIYYQQDDMAGNGPFGYGCLGSSLAAPTMSLSGEPKLGTSGTIDIAGMTTTSGPAWLFVGIANVGGIDLTGMGMVNADPVNGPTACGLFTSPIVLTIGYPNAGGSFSLPVTIPNTPSLVGASVALQSANVDVGANALGVAATAGHAVRLGN